MRRPIAAVAVAALLLLAGCTGANPLGDDGPAAETDDGDLSLVDEDELTTAGADDTAATTTAESGAETGDGTPPPGIAANGTVTNASALGAAHVAELRSLASYRLVVDREQRNGRIFANVAVDNRAREYAGEEAGGRIYHTNGTVYVKHDDGSVSDSEIEFRQIHVGGTELVGILDGLNLTVVNTSTADGMTVVRYRVTGFDRDLLTEIQNLTGDARVTTDGLVREVTLDATLPSGETLAQHYAIEAVNDTSVETPAWFEEYEQSGSEVSPQLELQFSSRDDGRVRIAHQGGESVESLTVRYTADGESVRERWTPEGSIAVGDTYATERPPDPGTAVRVIWRSGEQSAVLAQHEVPEE